MNLVELAKAAEVGGDSVERSDAAAVNRKENRPLYKGREPIYPKLAHGTFRRLKWAVMAVALAVYYLTPWIRWDRGANLPDQAVLIDFPARRFYFFFIEIWPQEVYYLTGLLILASFGLFLITALAGRVWCGYACPQTVWTDLFIMVERLVEGDRAERIRLAKAPMSAGKLAKLVTKHGIWLLIAMATGGAWVFYFADAPTLLRDLVTLQALPVAYITIGVLTFTTYALGGLMRHVALEGSRRGIRANIVAPGLVDTPLGRLATQGRPSRGRTPVPFGRQATGWEIANAALFLVSNESIYVTAQILAVDSGLTGIA